MHKKLLLSALLLTAMFPVAAVAQTNWSQNAACPGWNNPTAFTLGNANNCYRGQLGDRPNQAFDVMTGNTGMTWSGTILPASQMQTVTASSCSNLSSSGGVLPDNQKQFAIMTTTSQAMGHPVNRDPNTGDNLPFVPTQFNTNDTTPWFVNTNLTRSIRIGDCCANSGNGTSPDNAGASALYYNTFVTSQNAFMYIYYAIVVQAPVHGKDADPVFCIRVTKQSLTGGWTQISDTMAYYISTTPASNQGITISGNGGYGDVTLAPNYNTNGWHSNGGAGDNRVFYKDWTRVMLNLSDYLYENIRIEIMISDCAYNDHWAYAYVAGECRPMSLTTQGCPAGMSTDVATLIAPRGMSQYQWSASNMGVSDPLTRLNPGAGNDWFTFRDLTNPLTEAQGGYIYNVQASDFKVNYRPNQSHALIQPTDSLGQVVDSFGNRQTFRCRMTSALDPDKPYSSDLYISVTNTKPTMQIDSLAFCDGNVHLWNRSYVPGTPGLVVDSNTMWWMYSDPACTGTPLDTLRGDSINYNFGDTNLHGFIVRSITTDSSCYSDAIYTIKPPSKYTSDTSATAAGHFLWHGTDYNASGDYPDTLTSHEGCDSIVTLHLTITTDTHAYVDMGDGLLWATCNVGADNPWDTGGYFAWGETYTKDTYNWSTYSFSRNGSSTNFTRYTGSDYSTLIPEDDAATVNWGGEWRMPTDEEWTALRNTTNYSWVWQTNYNGTGAEGMLVTRLTGPCAGNSIFLPKAGAMNPNGFLFGGLYWSSTIVQGNRDRAWSIAFSNIDVQRSARYRMYGKSVRAVRPTTHTVAANANDTTMGSVTGNGSYTHGTTATLTATPNTGYHFVQWEEADSVYSRTADTIATIYGNRSFTAVFDISAVDLAITNVNLDVATSNVPQLTVNVTNSGSEDLTGECCIRIYKDYLGGDIVADCAMSARNIAAGETRSLSYFFFTSELCSLGEGDSLVFEVRTNSTQPDTIATNNVAGLNIGTLFPWRNTYDYVSDTVCDSLRWNLNNHLYRESGTYEYSAVTNYNGGRCDSIVVLDLTVNHGYSIDTFAIELDNYNWRGNEFRIGQTATFNSQVTMPTAAGCDSTVTLHLILIPTDTVTLLINDTTMGRIELAADTIHLDTLTADFTAQDGTVLTGRYDGAQHRIYIADGATVTLAGIDIPGRDYMQVNEVWNGITCLGDATLLLADGTMNKVNAYEFGAGIFVPQGKTLAIYGSTGWLNATAPAGAGIGGGTEGTNIHTTAGNIVIYGGNIIARCSEGSGIGSYTGTCGDITIHGGNIYATSLNSGAGIGTGAYGYCGNILITGGTVSATSGGYGAAIGTGLGYQNAQKGVCGDITIVGGNITALTQTHRDLAAIGTGTYGVCGNILIAGGTVEATGSVAIGSNIGHCGDIVIANTVTRMVSHTTHTYAFGDSYGAHVTIGNSEGWAYSFTADTDFYGTQPMLHPAPVSINYPSLITPIGNGRYRVAQNQNVVAKATPISCHHLVSWSITDSVLTTHSSFIIHHSSLNQYTNTPLLATLQRDLYTSDTTVRAVNHFTWNGTEYTTGGDFQHSLSTAEGCDSLATLHLTLDYIDTITLAVNDTNMGSISLHGAFMPTDTVDLSTIHGDYTVQDGTVLTGTLGGNHKISISAGASVMLKGVTINRIEQNNNNPRPGQGGNQSTPTYLWAGLSLMGNATIVLEDSNYVKGFNSRYPGIHVPEGATITIRGDGILTAVPGEKTSSPYFEASAIGGGYQISNGNIVIESGTIHAHGNYAAGIGGGYGAINPRRTCGNITIRGGNIDASSIGCGDSETIDSITITGGTVVATGNDFEAGIGSGNFGTVNHIIITGGTVIAQGGVSSTGIGGAANGHCGEVVIDSTVVLVTSAAGRNCTTHIGAGTWSTVDTVIVAGQGYTDLTAPFSYTGNGVQNNFMQPTAIDLGGNSYLMPRGKRVVVQATPKHNYHLAEWSDGAAVNADNTDTLTVNGAMMLTAIFAHDPYNIGAAAMDTATGSAMVVYNGTSASDIPVEPDSVCTITAIPRFGYHFVRWEEADSVYSRTADTSVTATSNRFFYAIFERTYDTITLAVNDTSMGSIAMRGSFMPTDTVDLSTIQGDYTVQDGTVLTGTLGGIYKISVAAGASVMLSNMDITGVHNDSYQWAGLNLLGDATIVLDDNSSNHIRGFYNHYPGIHVPVGATLTIRGNGELTAESGYQENVYYTMMAAGIGGGYNVPNGNIVIESGTITTNGGYGASLGGGLNNQPTTCGNIAIHGGVVTATSIGCGRNGVIDSILITGGIVNAVASTYQSGIGSDYNGTVNHIIITGGTVNATGGSSSAGIGGGSHATVNHITITGGTITATGGSGGAGIGSGVGGHCGEIVIDSSVTSVTASKDRHSNRIKNIGYGDNGTCDTVIVGGQPYTDPEADTYTFIGNGSAPQQNYYQPTVIALGGNSYSIQRGRTVVVQATPKVGHHLAEWSDGAAVNAEGINTLTVNGSMMLMAIFEQNPYIISTAAVDTAMGSAVVIYNDSVAATLPVLPDSTFILEATANPCYHFVCWTKGADTVASESIIELQATDTSFYMAHFERNLPLPGDTTAVVCDSLVWFGTAYTATDTATHNLLTAEGCDSTVTLHLTVKYSSTGDTTAVVCDSMSWYDTTFTSTPVTNLPTHIFTNAVGCDSTVTLNLTVNHSTMGDTTAVVCDVFSWYDYDTITASTNTLTTLFEAANQWGCDSTVTLHLTVNYKNTGDTTAVECDQFDWYEHTGLTSSVDTLTHFLEAANQWGCDSTVTLHLTVNYQNTGDTTAVECDQFDWYEHTGLTATVDTLTHLFANGNQWGCDSTVTLHLTVNYQNTGDTTAVECDQFDWYEHTGLTASVDTLTHLFASGNQWSCDSTVTLHLTVNYQNTGDTTAVECDQFSWYEHQNLTVSDTMTHLFAGANQWGCDSTVTLHLTINYQNTGDTTAVVCDSLLWYDTTYTASGAPTHLFANQWGCDSTVTLQLTVKYSSSSDTTAVACDQFFWRDTTYTATGNPERHYTNAVGCDSTVMLHLTVNYQNTGDTTAVSCDQFSWYEHQNLTASSNNLTHLFPSANQWGCDSTVTLDLTINYKNTGDTTAVACNQFSWYEHTGLTASVDTLKHLFQGGNHWGCDSTVTLHLTVNYQNTGDTTAVACDHFSWYQYSNLTTSSNNRTHRFVGANQWGCDSTVTLHLTVHYQNTGDTTAVACDRFSWYQYSNLTTSSSNRTHRFVGANQWGCDSTVTLHLTVHYQNTGDTSAVTYQPFNWYEHTNMSSTQNVEHTFVGANRWGCDSTVTLHLRYALFSTSWTGETTVTYNSQPQTGISATYVDDTGRTQQVSLTFTKGNETITTPNYPVNAGTWFVVAHPLLPVDSLSSATATLTILPATVSVSGAQVRIAKVADGTNVAEVTDEGTLNNIQGTDPLAHHTIAAFSDASVGEDKTITLTYTLQGDSELLDNYVLNRETEVYSESGVIIEPMQPVPQNTFDVAQYGYCTGEGEIGYHLSTGMPDQYRLDYADSRFADLDWTNLATPGPEGTITVQVPEGLPTGDYTVTVTFRDSRFPWIQSDPLSATFHVNLPASYTKPLFYNIIALIDTCQCFTDVQWYHRASSSEEWQAIAGANGYYYREVKGLTGEYFARVTMNGIHTYTCPQTDLSTLVRDEEQEVTVSAYPNPTKKDVSIEILHSPVNTHVLRVVSTVGVEIEHRFFDGDVTTLDLSAYQSGNYIVSVDGYIIRVVKN